MSRLEETAYYSDEADVSSDYEESFFDEYEDEASDSSEDEALEGFEDYEEINDLPLVAE